MKHSFFIVILLLVTAVMFAGCILKPVSVDTTNPKPPITSSPNSVQVYSSVNQDDEFRSLCAKSTIISDKVKYAVSGLENNCVMSNKARTYAKEVISISDDLAKRAKSLSVVKYGPEKQMFIEAMENFSAFGKAVVSAADAAESGDMNSASKYIKQGSQALDIANPLIVKIADGLYK